MKLVVENQQVKEYQKMKETFTETRNYSKQGEPVWKKKHNEREDDKNILKVENMTK